MFNSTTQSQLSTTLYKKPFENIVGKREMLVIKIFSFSHNVFYPFKNKFQFFSHLFLSSANAFNLDQSKISSFGKELIEVWRCSPLSMLTQYYTNPGFDDHAIESYWKHCGKGKKYSHRECVYVSHFKSNLSFRLQMLSVWSSLKFCCLVKTMDGFHPYGLANQKLC